MDETDAKTYQRIVWLCVVVALLAALAAGAGVFLRGDGATTTVTSVRGETYEMVTDGIYANNALRVVAEGVGWDYVTLFLAVPALLVSLRYVARGSLRGRLFAVGMLGYFLYQYLMYAVFWAIGPLFPLFIVIYPLAALAIILIVRTIDIESVPGRFTNSFPRTGMAIFSGVMAVLLTGMWTQRIATALSGDLEGASLLGQSTLTVQVMDLGMIVPIAIATAVLIRRDRPWGYVLSVVLAVKGATMAAAIVAMLLVAASAEGVVEWVPLAIFAAAAVASAALAYRMWRSYRPAAVA